MNSETVVSTTSGTVRGVVEGDVRRYSGIPFSSVAGRFRRPEPSAWDGVLDATKWGPAPHQPLPAYDDPGAPMAEDCLNVSIWAPLQMDEPLPVLLWLYGGGFEFGSNASPLTRGDVLAAHGDMIVVAINYRIGALGWAELAHLGGDLSEASNLGLHDVLAGLTWVQRNISAFGGDPSRITVMGESAGAFILGALLGVPEAQPLFSALAAFSGGASRIVPMDQARDLGDAILAALDTDPLTAEPSAWLKAQRHATPMDIGVRNAARACTLGVVDDTAEHGGLLSSHPLTAVTQGKWGSRRMLIGTTRDEAAFFPHPDHVDDGSLLTQEVFRWTDSAKAAELTQTYLNESSDIPSTRRRIITDWVYRLPAIRLADAVAAQGGRAYLSMVGRIDGAPAQHGVDVPGLFGRTSPEDSPAAAERAAEITSAIRRFVADDMGWSPTTPDSVSAHSFGEPDFDAAADYVAVRECWTGILRP